MNRYFLSALMIASAYGTAASAAQYNFSFVTTSALFGPDQNGSGVFTTVDTSAQIEGHTAFAITGISGQINNVTITGLTSAATSLIPTYYYFTDGPAFLSGTGVHFDAGAFRDIRFYAPSANPGTYAVSGNGTILANVNATSSVAAAVPEPATWSMMIGGFGAVGASMRRRRTNVTGIAVAH